MFHCFLRCERLISLFVFLKELFDLLEEFFSDVCFIFGVKIGEKKICWDKLK